MKMKKYFFMMIVAVMTIGFIGCTEEDAETCDSEDVGAVLCTNDISLVATFCTDGVNKSYYTYDGETYMCEGVEANTCEDALDALSVQLIEDGCQISKSGSLKTSEVKLSQMAEKLLLEVRSKSLCN